MNERAKNTPEIWPLIRVPLEGRDFNTFESTSLIKLELPRQDWRTFGFIYIAGMCFESLGLSFPCFSEVI